MLCRRPFFLFRRTCPVTDYELCYAVLLLLYLMECCVLVPENSVLFTRTFSRWRINRTPGCPFPGGKRLVLIHPLPWAAEWHIAPSPDATYTGQGVVTLNSLHDYPQGIPRPRLIRFDEPEARRYLRAFANAGYPVGRKQVVTPFAPQGGGKSKGQADTAGDPDLAQWTNSEPARARLIQLRGGLLFLKILCTMNVLWAFAGAPLLLAYFSAEGMFLPYVFILFWLGGTVAVRFAFTHRKVHRQRGKALLKALWLFIYPLAAMRALQTASAGVMPPCHESAVAGALMHAGGRSGQNAHGKGEKDAPDSEGGRYLADITAKLRHRLFYRSLTAEASMALAKANERLLQAIYANWGVSAAAPAHDPDSLEPGTVCYCPVCGIGLAAVMEACPHCLEVKTRLRKR